MEKCYKRYMDLDEAKKAFLDLFSQVKEDDKMEFLEWIEIPANVLCIDAEATTILQDVVTELRDKLPLESVLPTEKLYVPTHGENSDCLPESTLHVDAFLYDDNDVDDLVDNGQISRNYCQECGSKKTSPYVMISHSASRERLAYIFTSLLPPLDGKTVVDVGSRLGAALYAAHVYSTASNIIGIEMNQEFSNIQNAIITKFNFKPRVRVIEADVVTCAEQIRTADVILLNNVFEFFLSESQQIECWRFIYDNVRPNTLLVTFPSLEASLALLPQVHISLDEWVRPEEPYAQPHPAWKEEADQLNLYRVIGNV